MSTPSFALIGAVNHGKSSIAATLAEDDQIGISGDPGQTVESQRFDCRGAELTVWDTPGFQNPRGMLAEIRAAAEAASNPLDAFRDFASRHAPAGAFHAERELLRPLFYGACVLYVIDTSRPLMKSHEAEMELLRLTGLPRLAILNPTGPAEHEREWRAKLGQQFGAVYEFNAHEAGGAHRASLLRTMATVADEWRDELVAAAQKVEAEWTSRLEESAQAMIELLGKGIAHTRNAAVAPGQDKTAAVESLKSTFRRDLCRFEQETHAKLRNLFRHRRVVIEAEQQLPVGDDLFEGETWKVFGLSWQMLLTAGAVTGAVAGAAAGVAGEAAMPSGVATATGASVGALVGATAFVVTGKAVAQPSVKEEVDGGGVRSFVSSLGRKTAGMLSGTGTRITVGPLDSKNFPYILLDRAMVVVWYLASRAHAKRDNVHVDPAVLKESLDSIEASTQHWPEELRSACGSYVRAVAKQAAAAEPTAKFRSLLVAHLKSVCGRPFVAKTTA